MKLLTSTCVACLLTTLTVTTATAQVRVTIHDGLVTVVAKDATVRQIMAEWARVGQAKVVNAERIAGGPVTLELVDVPEVQALDTLLRSVAGYLAAPRAELMANLSRFDRVVVMPTSAAPRSQPVAQAPTFQPPQFPPQADDDSDERPNPNMPVVNPRGPVFGRFPAPQVINPQTGQPMASPNDPVSVPSEQQQPVYPSSPSAPFGGVAVPGMVAPAPQQQPGMPGQIVAPPQPGQTRRPGGV